MLLTVVAPTMLALLAPQAPVGRPALRLSHQRLAYAAMGVETPLAAGDVLPEVEVDVSSSREVGMYQKICDVLGEGRAILLGMPGAFTPTCTDRHLPGFYKASKEFADLGVEKIAIITANDRFVNMAWETSVNECVVPPTDGAAVEFIADPRGDLLESIGMIAYLGRGLGVRSKRFALLVEGGVAKHVAVDAGSEVLEETSAEALLEVVRAMEMERRARIGEEAQTRVNAELWNKDLDGARALLASEEILSSLRENYVSDETIGEAVEFLEDLAAKIALKRDTENAVAARLWQMSAVEALAYLEDAETLGMLVSAGVEDINEAIAIVAKRAGKTPTSRAVTSAKSGTGVIAEGSAAGGSAVTPAVLIGGGVALLAALAGVAFLVTQQSVGDPSSALAALGDAAATLSTGTDAVTMGAEVAGAADAAL
jgi:peroxiredoxin